MFIDMNIFSIYLINTIIEKKRYEDIKRKE